MSHMKSMYFYCFIIFLLSTFIYSQELPSNDKKKEYNYSDLYKQLFNKEFQDKKVYKVFKIYINNQFISNLKSFKNISESNYFFNSQDLRNILKNKLNSNRLEDFFLELQPDKVSIKDLQKNIEFIDYERPVVKFYFPKSDLIKVKKVDFARSSSIRSKLFNNESGTLIEPSPYGGFCNFNYTFLQGFNRKDSTLKSDVIFSGNGKLHLGEFNLNYALLYDDLNKHVDLNYLVFKILNSQKSQHRLYFGDVGNNLVGVHYKYLNSEYSKIRSLKVRNTLFNKNFIFDEDVTVEIYKNGKLVYSADVQKGSFEIKNFLITSDDYEVYLQAFNLAGDEVVYLPLKLNERQTYFRFYNYQFNGGVERNSNNDQDFINQFQEQTNSSYLSMDHFGFNFQLNYLLARFSGIAAIGYSYQNAYFRNNLVFNADDKILYNFSNFIEFKDDFLYNGTIQRRQSIEHKNISFFSVNLNYELFTLHHSKILRLQSLRMFFPYVVSTYLDFICFFEMYPQTDKNIKIGAEGKYLKWQKIPQRFGFSLGSGLDLFYNLTYNFYKNNSFFVNYNFPSSFSFGYRIGFDYTKKIQDKHMVSTQVGLDSLNVKYNYFDPYFQSSNSIDLRAQGLPMSSQITFNDPKRDIERKISFSRVGGDLKNNRFIFNSPFDYGVFNMIYNESVDTYSTSFRISSNFVFSKNLFTFSDQAMNSFVLLKTVSDGSYYIDDKFIKNSVFGVSHISSSFFQLKSSYRNSRFFNVSSYRITNDNSLFQTYQLSQPVFKELLVKATLFDQLNQPLSYKRGKLKKVDSLNFKDRTVLTNKRGGIQFKLSEGTYTLELSNGYIIHFNVYDDEMDSDNDLLILNFGDVLLNKSVIYLN